MTDLDRLFPGKGEMAQRMRRLDWASTPLGPVDRWGRSLRSAVGMLLASKAQILLIWGDDYVVLYNDAYTPVFGSKHPGVLGKPVREAWSEIWLSGLKDLFDGVVTSGEAFWATDRPFFIERHGYLEETYFDVSYDPVRDDDDRVGGLFCIVTETTGRVVGARRLATLRDLGRITEQAESVAEVYAAAADVLLESATDVPFALFYAPDADAGTVRLLASSGIDRAAAAASAASWPLGDELVVLEADALVAVGELRAGPWSEPIRQVAVVPVATAGQPPHGWLVAGISPCRRFDDDYRIFLGLVASNVAAAVTTVRRTEDERRRAEMLAELDRVKTDFFSNVSHEFRTPLTLMLGPLEEAKDAADIPQARRASLDVAHRNSLRLLRLVNTLLDFSRIEADRADASFEAVDVAAFTRDLASAFRSAVDKAGLSLDVRCESPVAPVYVDRDMWEKVVLNLISNAFKFTFDGAITITLVERGDGVELTVGDTGVGIPADELPHVFERFHRVRGTEGRTHEGTGIGLALVSGLVRLHGGDVRVESEVGVGSAFTVRIPTGSAHLPKDRVGGKRTRASTALGAAPFVAEAQRWLPDAGAREEPAAGESGSGVTTAGARIVVADDNADMRGYVVRLLERHWRVEAVGDGEAALAAIRRARPDLVLSDVMMPRLDGIALTRAIRADADLASLPIILVSARAGEEARIEGVDAQADDYLTKPFSARELVARVNVHLELQKVRRESEAAIRASEQRFRTFVTASADVVYRMSPDWSEMRFLVGRDFIGDTQEPSRSWLDTYIHPDDQAHVMEVIQQAIRTKSPFELEHRVLRLDGTLGWTGSRAVPLLDERGEILEWFGTASDLTVRKQAEEDIRRRGAQFATLIGEAPVGVYLVDADFEIREVNPLALPLFSQIGNPIGRNFDQVIHVLWPKDHADDVVRRFRHTLATGEPHHAPEVRGERTGKVYEWQINRIPLPDGRFGVVCYFRDISEQVEARERIVASEERARDARVEAEAANRAKDDFLATVSHELRSPLQGILGWLTLLKRGQLDAGQTNRALEAVERSVRLQGQLVHDIMDISRIVAGKVELERTPLDLAGVLRATAEEFAPAAVAKKIELVSDLDRSNLVMGDRERLHQVFSNLLSNAFKFTPEGGRVTLACRREGDEVIATVSDTGDGIGAEFLPRLFDRFTQADTSSTRRYGGLGLGLAIVRNLVELHGGRVSAESGGVGRGATFSVRLRVALAHGAVRPSAAELRPESVRLNGIEILLVEDDRDSLEAMRLSLEAVGAAVRPATSVREAWSSFTDRPPDVVVSDLSMPAEDGYALLERIRHADRSVPAIALTGFTRPEDRARVLAAGFAAHVAKPIDPDELVKVLVHVLARPPDAVVG